MRSAAPEQAAAGDSVDWRSQVLDVRQPQDKAVSTYTRLAPVYEIWARATESKARRRVLEAAAPRDGESILEVAAGTGVQLAELARRNPTGRTTGIELADGMLAQARKRLDAGGLADRVELLQADALAMPFEDETFDLVTNAYMLDLLAHDAIQAALAEMKRVLRPGGRLVLSNMTKAERARHRLWDALYARGLGVTANCRGVWASPVLHELGFTDVRRDYVAQMLFPTEVVSARVPLSAGSA